MKIQVRKIGPEGMVREEALPAGSIGLTRADDVRFIAPVAIKARINRAENELLVDISAQSRYESFCYRCLEDVARDWKTEFSLNFECDKQTEFIETDEDIRQELILNLPARILCEDDCKGLCIDCGVNLNNQKCEHEHSVMNT